MSQPNEERLTWVAEMPVPASNIAIHFQTYLLEQWLRRIALAALMAKGGSDWVAAMPKELLPDAKKQAGLLKRRTFLDPENSDNLVWALTVDQIRRVLTDPELSPFVFGLTAMSRRDLEQQLSKLRDIRNIVAHQRATTDVTHENFRLVGERLEGAIRNFKRDLLYPGFSDRAEPLHVTGEGDEADFSTPGSMGDFFAESGLASGRQFILSDLGRFYDFNVLPVDPDMATGGFADTGSILDQFHEVRRAVLCIRLPFYLADGGFGVIWPKDVSDEELSAIRDACLSVRADSDVPYNRQDLKHVCDPMIWFDQGVRGGAEVGLDLARLLRPLLVDDEDDDAGQ